MIKLTLKEKKIISSALEAELDSICCEVTRCSGNPDKSELKKYLSELQDVLKLYRKVDESL